MGELIASLENYSIYKSYVNNDVSYYLCVPNGSMSKCQIVLGFANENLDSLSQDELISKISEVNNMVFNLNNESIYAIPNIDEIEFKNAVLENDNRLYENILNNKIHPITQDIYNMLIKNGIKKNKISQIISVIKRTDDDKKFTFWLSMKLGDNYINEIDYKELLDRYNLKEKNTSIEIDTVNYYTLSATPIENIDISTIENNTNEIVNESGIAPVNRDYENTQVIEKENRLVKRLTKPVDKSPGFSSFKFIIIFMLITIIFGISIGYLLVK